MTDICSIAMCEQPRYARGWCKNHYYQAEYHGAFNPRPKAKAGAHERFLLEHVNYQSDECLLWPFPLNPGGYGKIVWKRQHTSAHRQMCRLAHGEPPSPAYLAAHSCNNGKKGCVNPNHVRWATAVENQFDKHAQGTAIVGQKNHSAKLTAEQVVGIIIGNERPCILARRYGVAPTHICHIRRGGAWTHVTGIIPKTPRLSRARA